MTLDDQPGQQTPLDLTAALNQLWIRFLPEIHERISVLQAAALACSSGGLSQEMREEAHAAAHKLAGTLGTFNLSRGTELAREAEQFFSMENMPTAEQVTRLTVLATEIGVIVNSR
jgi:HPt (histidine-containing phosphotransfer) domain-containing protein